MVKENDHNHIENSFDHKRKVLDIIGVVLTIMNRLRSPIGNKDFKSTKLLVEDAQQHLNT